MDLFLVFCQTVAIYVFLVVVLSRVGRLFMAGLTPAGYMVIALLGSAVETGLYRGSGALTAGLVSAATILVLDQATTLLMNKWPRLRRRLVGAPLVLIHDGQVISDHLRQIRMTEEDLRAAVRKRGYDDFNVIRLAVMEIDGGVGVVPKADPEIEIA